MCIRDRNDKTSLQRIHQETESKCSFFAKILGTKPTIHNNLETINTGKIVVYLHLTVLVVNINELHSRLAYAKPRHYSYGIRI